VRTLERSPMHPVLPGDIVVVDAGAGPVRVPTDNVSENSAALVLLGAQVGQRVRWCGNRGPMLLKVLAIETTSA